MNAALVLGAGINNFYFSVVTVVWVSQSRSGIEFISLFPLLVMTTDKENSDTSRILIKISGASKCISYIYESYIMSHVRTCIEPEGEHDE